MVQSGSLKLAIRCFIRCWSMGRCGKCNILKKVQTYKITNAQKNEQIHKRTKMKKSWLIPAIAVTLILLNIGRAIGGLFFYYTSLYQRVLNDEIHHYQIGLLILPIGHLLLKTYPRAKSVLYGVATAFILDELFFITEFFGVDPYFHRTFFRWMSFDLTAFLIFTILYELFKKREFVKNRKK